MHRKISLICEIYFNNNNKSIYFRLSSFETKTFFVLFLGSQNHYKIKDMVGKKFRLSIF